MLNIIRMNPSGQDGIRTTMTFEFTFDNSNELPKSGVYTMNQVIYVIANNSIAINNIDNSVYKFNGKQWIKTGDKIIPNNINNITSNGNYILSSSPTSTNTNVSVNIESEPNIDSFSVTENGVYNASEEGLDGFSTVDVNVSVTGMPKLVSPSGLVATLKNYKCKLIHSNGGTYLNVGRAETWSSGPGATRCYGVTTYPVQEISFDNDKQYGDYCTIIFTANSNNIAATYFNGTQWRTIDLGYSFTAGKVYRADFEITIIQGNVNTVEVTTVTEYNEPITFTVE